MDSTTVLDALRTIWRKKAQSVPKKKPPTTLEILRLARNQPKIHSPRRTERVEALISKWLDELTDPNTDPIEFLLRKMAEVVVDASDE